MGEAKRKRQQKEQSAWPGSGSFRGTIDLRILPPVAAINGARIRELTGDETIPDTQSVILKVFRAVVGDRRSMSDFALATKRALAPSALRSSRD